MLGQFGINPRPNNAEFLINETFETLQPLAEEKSLQMKKEVKNISQQLHCDHEYVLQVLSNLVGNSIKFTPAGGIIRVTAEEQDAFLHFSVEDSGPGISRQQLPHVFDRYWQGKNSGKCSVGLGLSISKKIVEAHGGQIWVEANDFNKGAKFHFTLPFVNQRISQNSDKP